MTRAGLLALALALLPAASRDPLAGYAPAGPPTRCIDLSSFADSVVPLDRQTIGVHRSSTRWYVGHVAECPALEPSATLIIERFGSDLCDTDRFRVLRQGETIPSAFCRVDSFVPYEKVKRRP